MGKRRKRGRDSTGETETAVERTDRTGEAMSTVRSRAQAAVLRASGLGEQASTSRLAKWTRHPIAVSGIFAGGLLVLVIAIYLLFSLTGSGDVEVPMPGTQPPSAPAVGEVVDSAESVLRQIFGTPSVTPAEMKSWPSFLAAVALRLSLAALLAGVLAFRPRKDLSIVQRNPYVMQSQILLAVVAAALMMVVADNAARAFGIFAAASLVRFRTTVRDPKEITVLLIGLAIGLASGVGYWEIAIIMTAFVLLLLSILEHYEPEQLFRAMELELETRNIDDTEEILKDIFARHEIDAELRAVDRESDDSPAGEISFLVRLAANIDIDRLSDEIFSTDPHNILGISWDQKKTSSYIYR